MCIIKLLNLMRLTVFMILSKMTDRRQVDRWRADRQTDRQTSLMHSLYLLIAILPTLQYTSARIDLYRYQPTCIKLYGMF